MSMFPRFIGFRLFHGLVALLTIASPLAARAHDEPTSFLEVLITPAGMETSVVASVTDLAHDLSGVEPGMLLDPSSLKAQSAALFSIMKERLTVEANGNKLSGVLRDAVPMPEKRDAKFTLFYPWEEAPQTLTVTCRLFPYDPRHRTFLTVRDGGGLLRQEIFEGPGQPKEIGLAAAPQSLGAVFKQFVASGVHHIFIGPDHILFVVGLLLLGGGMKHLLKIVTAFTVAHSITLCLAAFRILTPPAAIIEPIIALSIVFVGCHALLGRGKKDPRILFAFVFGLIHGFGFANVLQEMELPRHALGWSLFAFNTGVEIGQACIVLAVAPALALLKNHRPRYSETVTAFGSLIITGAGAFWFFQRVLG